MNRSRLNLTIDILASACLLVMVGTGYILRFPLPPGTNRTHLLWEISRHDWGTIHSWAGGGLFAVLCLHVVLHWEWIFATIRRRLGRAQAAPGLRLRTGILTMAALFTGGGLFALATHRGVRELDTPLHLLPGTDQAPALLPERATLAETVDFHRDVMPIFEASCIDCHGPAKQHAHFRADRREDFFAAQNGTPLIVPASAKTSRLIAIVSGEVKDMRSAKAHLLPPHEIALLRKWIDAGAAWPEEQGTNQINPKP